MNNKKKKKPIVAQEVKRNEFEFPMSSNNSRFERFLAGSNVFKISVVSTKNGLEFVFMNKFASIQRNLSGTKHRTAAQLSGSKRVYGR